MSDEPSHNLVFPFLDVVSQGGRYDDDSVVRGYELGRLAAILEHANDANQRYVEPMVVHTDNYEQLDVCAMHFRWLLVPESYDEGWIRVQFRRTQTVPEGEPWPRPTE